MNNQTIFPYEKEPIYHVGVSTGKDSSGLLLWVIFKSGLPRHRVRVTFSDTGNEDPITYQHLEVLRGVVEAAGIVGGLETLIPPLQFFDLCFKKGRFPSRKAQFCTTELKIEPLRNWIRKQWAAGEEVVLLNGKRSGESEERRRSMAGEAERGFSDFWGCEEWTPIRDWTFADILAIHKAHGVPLNPLYAMGASRVGCWPCVNCGKPEIRLVASHRPEKIDQIEAEEKRHNELGRISTFYHGKTTPKQFHDRVYTRTDGKKFGTAGIRQVVKWAHTKRGGKEPIDPQAPSTACHSKYLSCE
jgi:3'-phosphoadenosine 5'-phosphosulfate sulfotransferase (PAPS reductase)/FAD synthetase